MATGEFSREGQSRIGRHLEIEIVVLKDEIAVLKLKVWLISGSFICIIPQYPYGPRAKSENRDFYVDSLCGPEWYGILTSESRNRTALGRVAIL